MGNAAGASKASGKKSTYLPTNNFKGPPIQHVRIVTLLYHHSCLCEVYGAHATALTHNIRTLNVVPNFHVRYRLDRKCEIDEIFTARHQLDITSRLREFFMEPQASTNVILFNLDDSGALVPHATHTMFLWAKNNHVYSEDECYGSGLHRILDIE